MAGDNTLGDLPPRPDRQTGEPRPPSAPTQNAGGYNEQKPSRVPAPPEGQGPVLEYYRQSQVASWLTALAVPAVLLLIFFLHSGTVIFSYWFTWVFLGAGYAIALYRSRTEVVTAGADWLKFGKRWVRTYELTNIEYKSRGMNGYEFMLADSERKLAITPYVIQANPQLWDLVHLGMRHSAANGAKLNNDARAGFPEIAAELRRAPTSHPRSDTPGEPR